MDSLIGTSLGQYEIREKIGKGGMAHVFKAYHRSLDRFVAVKVLSPNMAEEEGFAVRFQREARSIARLHHPNILQVHDFGQHGKYYYIVMHYVENSRTLSDLIHDNTPLGQLIQYIIQVSDALNFAHEQGIIHRDVKPSNILIDGQWALLSDFGLVKMTEMSSELTGTGTTMGTPAYMSPEQAAGRNVDRRTDIYALGIILHRILTGTIPHDAPTPMAIALKRTTEPVPSLRQAKADVPESLEHVTLRALAIQPDARYSTASEFATALKTAETNPDFRERTISDMGRDATVLSKSDTLAFPRSKKRGGLAVGVAAAVGAAVVIVVALILLFLFFRPDDDGGGGQPVAQAGNSGSSAAVPASLPTDTPIPTDTPTPAPGTPVALAKTILDVRSGPGDAYDLVGRLQEGATAQITGQDETGEWWQIIFLPAEDERGWISADASVSEASDADNMPIALAPPTPTATPVPATDTPTPEPSTATPVDTDTPVPTPTATSRPATATSAATAVPTTPPTPTVPVGKIILLKPASLEEPSFGVTEFEWQWNGPLPENQGFEVRVWRDGEPPAGVHNSVLDNQNGEIQAVGNSTYRLVADITDTPGVTRRSGEYNWTVVLIQMEPYQDLGIQSDAPGRLRFDLPGGGGGGDGGGGGGGDGGGFN